MNQREMQCVQRKLRILNEVPRYKSVSRLCRHYGISRELFYRWKRAYDRYGEEGLRPKKHGPKSGFGPHRFSKDIEDKVVELRKTFGYGQLKLSWFLKRYYGITMSPGGVRGILTRHGLNRLPRRVSKRELAKRTRYEKRVPGHHVQLDVKLLFFRDRDGKRIKRFQYTAIDDATRLRVLKIYSKHTQKNAIAFIDHVIERFPFRIGMVRTDNGHEFQSQFRWHVQDQGISHVYIKKASPHLNGKVERSHRVDHDEFYQHLNYKDDKDLNRKLESWERFYNRDRPHSAHKGKTPLEILRERLQI